MKFEKLITAFAVLFLTANFAIAQDKFLRAVEGFSTKKITYITLDNGKKVEGTFRNWKRKKGQILEIKIKDSKGNKKTYAADEIKTMYLPQSGLDKLGKSLEVISAPLDWQKDQDNNLDSDLLTDGYAYFEKVEAYIKKKKKMNALMQLVNPSFENNIRVYFDPWADETISAGVAGVKLAGGIDKSYFVKKGNEVAYRLKKKDYKDQAGDLFGKCKSVKSLMKKWSDFEEAVYLHAKDCK